MAFWAVASWACPWPRKFNQRRARGDGVEPHERCGETRRRRRSRARRHAAEACAASDVTFVMVSTPGGGRRWLTAKDGLSAGKGYVDVSTVDAETSSAIAEIVRSTGAEFLEAPVSGSKKPAEDGALIFLCAGDETLYRRCSEPLETMGKAHFFLGDVGQGAKMKLVVNMIMGSMMTAFAEGLTLSEKPTSIRRRCFKSSLWAPSRRPCSRSGAGDERRRFLGFPVEAPTKRTCDWPSPWRINSDKRCHVAAPPASCTSARRARTGATTKTSPPSLRL